MPAIDVKRKYGQMKALFDRAILSTDLTNALEELNNLCQQEISTCTRTSITSQTTAIGKNYIVFVNPATNKISRPVNIDLYDNAQQPDSHGNSKIDAFWENVRNHSIDAQSADEITSVLYCISMNYCCCADLFREVSNNSGKYFEILIGHLYAMHLNITPSNQLNAVELDGESITLPTDYIFDLGAGRPKLHIPVKTSTRERVVEVWAQQRILDGAFGVGRFFCLLTCIGETNYRSEDNSVGLTCVPNQWMNYQLFIAQITRAYYLDIPGKYNELNNRFPKIHVKQFGEFFHESSTLFD